MTSAPATVFDSLCRDAVSDQETLRHAYALPSETAVRKQMTELTEQARRLIGCASLVLVASADAEGNFDVSPRGGPAGFVTVLDSRTLAIPDATGNKRLDTLQNEVPRVGWRLPRLEGWESCRHRGSIPRSYVIAR